MSHNSFGRRICAALALVVALVLGTAGTASAGHAWGGYHWAKGSAPVVLIQGDNVSSAWDPYLGQSTADWTASAVLDTAITAGSTNPRRCNPTTGMVEVCSAKYGDTGWLGLAQIWLDANGHITQGTAKMNDTYFALVQYNTPEQRAHVMCQEVGHTFGLGHTSEDGSSQATCMDYSTDPGSTRPNAHDYEQLDVIYGHSDGTTTTTTTTRGPSRGASGVDVDERRDWGRMVEKRGNQEVFVRELGSGQRLVTFVTLAS